MSKLIIMLIIAYLLGSIPTGIIIGKLFFNTDIRKAGSGNIGTTNTFRVLGKKAGIAVLLIDLLKGALASSQTILFGCPIVHGISINGLIIGVFAILGNACSIFDHFQGGKTVATSAGVLAGYNFPFFLIAILIFAIITYITSTVSIASMLTLILVVLISFLYHDPLLTIVAIIATILVFYKHRTNIQRIIQHKENIVPFGLYYSKLNKNKNKDK